MSETAEATEEKKDFSTEDIKKEAEIGESTNGTEIKVSTEDISEGYDPFNMPVKERAYTKPQLGEHAPDIVSVKEPEFIAAPMPTQESSSEAATETSSSDNAGTAPPKPPASSGSSAKPAGDGGGEAKEAGTSDKKEPIQINPVMNELDEKEKNEAAELLVDSVLDAYEMIHQAGRHFAKVHPEKLQRLVEKDEIDLNTPVPTGDGEFLPLGQFYYEYNADIDEKFVVTPDFKRKIREPMKRLFKKHNIGLSDGQFIAMQFGKDVVQKGVMLYSFKKQMKVHLDEQKKMHEERMKSGDKHFDPKAAQEAEATHQEFAEQEDQGNQGGEVAPQPPAQFAEPENYQTAPISEVEERDAIDLEPLDDTSNITD